VTYTETGLHLEYCFEPLSQLLSDRVCTYARAQRAVAIQPMSASIPLAATLVDGLTWQQRRGLEITRCDRDWYEVTLSGLWLTEPPNEDEGIFMTELDVRLEHRLLHLWAWSQQSQSHKLTA